MRLFETGVYLLEFWVEGERYVYIGGVFFERGFRDRWNEHLSKLRRNKHTTPRLQKMWNEYSESFSPIIYRRCHPNVVEFQEFLCKQKFLKELGRGFILNSDLDLVRTNQNHLWTEIRLKKSNEAAAKRFSNPENRRKASESLSEGLKKAWQDPIKRKAMLENRKKRFLSKPYTIDGVTKTLPEWCEAYGLDFGLVKWRLWMKWDLKRALTTPFGGEGSSKHKWRDKLKENPEAYQEYETKRSQKVKDSHRKKSAAQYTINGETKCLKEWCEIYKVNYDNVWYRVRVAGWDMLEALTTPSLKPWMRKKKKRPLPD